MRRGSRFLAALLVVALSGHGCTGDDGAAASTGAGGLPGPGGGGGAYPRNETLYTSGTQWGPPNSWNPIIPELRDRHRRPRVRDAVPLRPGEDRAHPVARREGRVGRQDLHADAARGHHLGRRQAADRRRRQVHRRARQDQGRPVQQSLDLAQRRSTRSTRARCEFTFSDPRIQEWENWLYENAIVPKHIWESRSEADITTTANEKPIGTGPYEYLTPRPGPHGVEEEGRLVGDQGAQPRRQAELHRRHRQLQQRGRARPAAAGQAWTCPTTSCRASPTWSRASSTSRRTTPSAPYMLSANTAMLIPNTTKAPMNDAAFRRALASLDRHQEDRRGRVRQHRAGRQPDRPAAGRGTSSSTRRAVTQNGFTFDTAQGEEDARRRRLQGHATATGSSRRPDGDADQAVADRAGRLDRLDGGEPGHQRRRAGRRASTWSPEFPDAGALDDARTAGTFDLLLNNWAGLSNTPWHYYNYVFQLPVQKQQFTANFAPLREQGGVGAGAEAGPHGQTPTRRSQTTMAELEKIHLTELPMIPLWYNGLWAQYNTTRLDQLAVGRAGRAQGTSRAPGTTCGRWAASRC